MSHVVHHDVTSRVSLDERRVQHLDPLPGDLVPKRRRVVRHLAGDLAEVECVEEEDEVLHGLVVLDVGPLVEIGEAQPVPVKNCNRKSGCGRVRF